MLHVLPHPGGGGETYVDALSRLEGYRFERTYLARSASPNAWVLPRAAGVVRRARRTDLVHVHGEIASALSLPALATRPSVVTLHGLHLWRRTSGAARAAGGANLRLLLRAASRTICVSQAEYDEVSGFAGGRAVVIRNGVEPLPPVTDAERADARARFRVDGPATVGAWIGSLDDRKDPLTPIAAAKASPGVTLLIAGDGPLRAAVEQEAAASVRVLGFQRDVRAVLAAADFFVLSSRREGLSFAVLEAMSLGLVPLVSDAPGNPEAVGDAGIVVPFGSREAFAEAFARLAAGADERRALGERARERVQTEFRADEMRRRTREVYEQVLAERASPRRRRA